MKKLISVVLSLFVIAAALKFNSTGADNNIVKRVNSSKKRIAITFDDGPHYKYTEEILDILKEYNVKATFFVIGTNAERFPEIVEREVEEGHEIGNHTYDHVYLKGIDSSDIDKQISGAECALADACDYTPKLLRPPGGMYDEKLPLEARKMGYTIVLWSVDTRDWSHPAVSTVVDGVLGHIRNGDIILMHDFIGGAPSPTPEALKTILPALIADGYEFVTVSELISD